MVGFTFIFIAIVFVISFIIIIKQIVTNKKDFEHYSTHNKEEVSKYEKMLSTITDEKTKNKKEIEVISKIFIIIGSILLMITFVMFFIPVSLSFLFVKQIVFILGFIFLIIGLIIKAFIGGKFNSQYKEKIIKTLIKEKYPSLNYDMNLSLTEKLYLESILDNYDEYYSNDLIKGQINNYNVTIADIATYDIHTDSDGDRQKVSSFRGTYVIIELKKDIKSIISILNSLSIDNRETKVKIDNTEFVKYHHIYSDNRIMTLRLLTPDVLEELLAIEKQLRTKLDIKIVNNKLYIRINTNDMFEALSVDDKKLAIYTYKYMSIFDNLIKLINTVCKEIEELEV